MSRRWREWVTDHGCNALPTEQASPTPAIPRTECVASEFPDTSNQDSGDETLICPAGNTPGRGFIAPEALQEQVGLSSINVGLYLHFISRSCAGHAGINLVCPMDVTDCSTASAWFRRNFPSSWMRFPSIGRNAPADQQCQAVKVAAFPTVTERPQQSRSAEFSQVRPCFLDKFRTTGAIWRAFELPAHCEAPYPLSMILQSC